MTNQKFEVTGMACASCSSRVEKTVAALEGVNNVQVNLLTNSMQVTYQEDKINNEKIEESVILAGYGAKALEEKMTAQAENFQINHENQKSDSRKEVKSEYPMSRFWFSLLFLVPLMYLAMHHMLKVWFGLPVPTWMVQTFHGSKNAGISAFTQFLLLLPILFLNKKYYKSGFHSLLRRNPNMDSLIAIGTSAAILYGIYAIFQILYALGYQNFELAEKFGMDLYFESAGTILTLVTLGKSLEEKAKRKTGTAVRKLMDLTPKTAVVERDGKEIEVPANRLQVGDLVIVKPGASIPADGIVIEGNTSVDEAAITGESIPIEKNSGDEVIAATTNKNGYFKFQVIRAGQETRFANIIRLVEEASSSKAPIAKLADQVAGVFVPVVILIAVISVIFWLLSGATVEFALSIGIAVLVISCPCALGLATPVAIMVGTGKGAEHGILIKSGEALEIGHKIDTIILDKTGTITEGAPKVTNIKVFDHSEEEVIRIAASLESRSEHPVAEAILLYAKEKNAQLQEVQEFEMIPGRGIKGKVDGIVCMAGNQALLVEQGILIYQNGQDHQKVKELQAQLEDEGKTVIFIVIEENLAGVIAVADVIKATSKEAVEAFHNLGLDVIVMTGDQEKTARAVCRDLPLLQIISQVLPEEKEQKIAELQKAGHTVAMIGDGINDAPALVRAELGIAIGAGTDVAMESADIVLMKSDLLDAVTAIKLSKSVIRNIKQNLSWAFIYNIIGIPLAAGVFYPLFGWKLNPMFAAAAMSLSSLCVVGNALRLKLFQK